MALAMALPLAMARPRHRRELRLLLLEVERRGALRELVQRARDVAVGRAQRARVDGLLDAGLGPHKVHVALRARVVLLGLGFPLQPLLRLVAPLRLGDAEPEGHQQRVERLDVDHAPRPAAQRREERARLVDVERQVQRRQPQDQLLVGEGALGAKVRHGPQPALHEQDVDGVAVRARLELVRDLGRQAPRVAAVVGRRERLGRTRVIQRRFNVSVPRARVTKNTSTLRDRSER